MKQINVTLTEKAHKRLDWLCKETKVNQHNIVTALFTEISKEEQLRAIKTKMNSLEEEE